MYPACHGLILARDPRRMAHQRLHSTEIEADIRGLCPVLQDQIGEEIVPSGAIIHQRHHNLPNKQQEIRYPNSTTEYSTHGVIGWEDRESSIKFCDKKRRWYTTDLSALQRHQSAVLWRAHHLIVPHQRLVRLHAKDALAVARRVGKVLPRRPGLPVVRGAFEGPELRPRRIAHGDENVGDMEFLQRIKIRGIIIKPAANTKQHNEHQRSTE